MTEMSFRIYGDNIIECTRIISMIKENESEEFEETLRPNNQMSSFIILKNENFELEFELVPGFEKSNKKRWKQNILDEYKKIGSILDETADALITRIDGNKETIITVIEFCSALQAGNQAWQRSGRAYSCARTKIPYFYVIDLPKYELDPDTRERKALRFPNAIVPFSYITYSSINDTVAYELIVKSQEYNEDDEAFDGYDMDNIFNSHELGNFLLNILTQKDTSEIVEKIKNKNINFVNFLASENSETCLSADEIRALLPSSLAQSIIDSKKNFAFEKKIAKKSISGNLAAVHEIIKANSIGIFSSDLPFGIIPKNKIFDFLNSIKTYYPLEDAYKNDLLSKDYLIVTMIKGFKPGGDDNRPDRGIMPLLRMLFGEEATVLTVLYGPLIKSNYKLLTENLSHLAKSNGLWQTIINLSDYLLYDCPIINENHNESGLIKLNHTEKEETINAPFNKLDLTPVNFREDDVDSLFYMMFKYESKAFYGICNPPGGDWSGMSLLHDGIEYRWLSLPRVSDDKRPDHIVQFNTENHQSFLLIMESKEKPEDLEKDIGPRLSQYVGWLLNSAPNVECVSGEWKKSNLLISYDEYTPITSGSFISKHGIDHSSMLKTSDCDIIYSCILNKDKWDLDIYYKKNKKAVAEFIALTKPIFEKSKLLYSVNYNSVED